MVLVWVVVLFDDVVCGGSLLIAFGVVVDGWIGSFVAYL